MADFGGSLVFLRLLLQFVVILIEERFCSYSGGTIALLGLFVCFSCDSSWIHFGKFLVSLIFGG